MRFASRLTQLRPTHLAGLRRVLPVPASESPNWRVPNAAKNAGSRPAIGTLYPKICPKQGFTSSAWERRRTSLYQNCTNTQCFPVQGLSFEREADSKLLERLKTKTGNGVAGS